MSDSKIDPLTGVRLPAPVLSAETEIQLLALISQITSTPKNLHEILDLVIEQLLRHTTADMGVVYAFDSSPPHGIYPLCARGIAMDEAAQLVPHHLPTSPTWNSLRGGMIIDLPSITGIPAYARLRRAGIGSFIIVPLSCHDNMVGSINLAVRGQRTWPRLSETALRTIACLTAMAMERVRLDDLNSQTSRKLTRISASRQDQEALWRQVVMTAPAAAAVMVPRGKILFANDKFAQLFGYKNGEELAAAGIKLHSLLCDEMVAEVTREWTMVAATTRVGPLQGMMRRRDGSMFFAEFSAGLVSGTLGHPQVFLGMVQDLSQQRRQEEALQRSDARYRTLTDAANDMIFIIDRDDRVAYVNRCAARYLRREVRECLGLPRAELFGAETSQRQGLSLQEIFRSGQPLYIENRTEFPDRVLWLGTWLAPVFSASGEVDQVLGLSRDITELRETAQRLKNSEQRLRDIIERSPLGYYFVDNTETLRDWNQAYLDILQLDAQPVTMTRIMELSDEEGRKLAARQRAQVRGGKSLPYAETRISLPSGKTVWVSWNARRVIEDGIVTGFEGFISDITEAKQVAEALRVSEARYRSLIHSIRYEVYGLDLKGRFHEANAAFQESWGAAPGRTIAEVIRDRAFARRLKEMTKRVLRTRNTVQNSMSIVRPDGSTIYYSVTISPVKTSDGELIGMVGMNLDVTEQAVMLHSLRTMSMRLVEVQEEERRRIAAEIHDSLGQQLAALQFEVTAAVRELAAMGKPPQALNQAISTIDKSITLAQNICYDLRPPLLDDFGLEAALRDYVDDYRDHWDHEIQLNLEEVSSLLSREAQTAFFRVAQEALNNVRKHARAQNIRIDLWHGDHQVELAIQDNGQGFQVDQTPRPPRSDHYGLMTMKERIQFLGGSFSVESAPGSGTRVVARLPEVRR